MVAHASHPSQHIFNFVMMYGEVMLTNIHMLPHMLGMVGLWSVTYGLFAIFYHQMTGTWTVCCGANLLFPCFSLFFLVSCILTCSPSSVVPFPSN